MKREHPAALGVGARSAPESKGARERRLGWALTAPAFAVMMGVTAWPMLRAVWLSLHSWRLTDPAGREWSGLRNYQVVLSDPLWWDDVATTTLLTLVTVGVELVLGMAFALVMHRALIGRRLVRTAVLIPYGLVTVVAGFAWRYAFALDTGFVNGWLGLGELSWFGARGTALAAIALAEIWKTTPFMSLLLLAGLAQVPEELHEAARLDGAGAVRSFLSVTLPAMRTSLLVAVLFRALDAYRIFDTVFVMTAGAQRTETVSFLAYRQMIGRTALGLGSAVSVLLFLTVTLFAAAFVKVLRLELAPAGGAR